MSNLVVVWRVSNVDRHPKLATNKNIRVQISTIWILIQISAIWIPILCINSLMNSKSIAIAYSYTKQHRKKMKRIIPKLSFTTGETQEKKKRERERERDTWSALAIGHPPIWKSPCIEKEMKIKLKKKKMKKKPENVEQMKQRKSNKREFLNNNR